MSSRSVLLVAAVFGAGALSFLSCSAPDPASLTFSERPRGGSEQSSGGASSGSTPDGGSSGEQPDPIFGTDPFAYVNPGQRANEATPTHDTPLEGKNCVNAGCHEDGPGPKWAFAGTVYSSITGGATVAEAEVRVVGPDGNEFGRAYTDQDGNFWLEKDERPPAGSRVGVRRAGARPMYMASTIEGTAGAGCNSDACHGMPTQRIYVP